MTKVTFSIRGPGFVRLIVAVLSATRLLLSGTAADRQPRCITCLAIAVVGEV
jgi:hypothetical protein